MFSGGGSNSVTSGGEEKTREPALSNFRDEEGLSFLIISKDFFFGPFLIGHRVSQSTILQLSPKAARSPGGTGLQRRSGPHCVPCVYLPSQHPTDGRPRREPAVSCLGRCSLLLVMSPSLTNNGFHLIVEETACSKDARGQCLAPVVWASKYMGVASRDQRCLFFPGTISRPFPPLDRIQGSHC